MEEFNVRPITVGFVNEQIEELKAQHQRHLAILEQYRTQELDTLARDQFISALDEEDYQYPEELMPTLEVLLVPLY